MNSKDIMIPTEVIIRGTSIYLIKQTIDESREVWLDRSDRVIRMWVNEFANTDNKVLEDIINLSYLWRNVMIYGMSYPSQTMKKINQMNGLAINNKLF
jgi:hypothetical protein